jgi:DUF1680 family protein
VYGLCQLDIVNVKLNKRRGNVRCCAELYNQVWLTEATVSCFLSGVVTGNVLFITIPHRIAAIKCGVGRLYLHS